MDEKRSVEPPELQRELIAAHEAFMRASWAVVTSRRIDLPNLADQVAYAVFGQLMQLTRAVHRLATTCYGGEAKPLARAALSAAATVKAILGDDVSGFADDERQAELDGRALQYVLWEQEIRRRRNAGYVRQGLIPEEAAKENLARAQTEVAKKTDELTQRGIKPRRLGDERSDTWHGLSERRLMERLNLADWYDLYYGTFSEEAHVSVAAVRTQLISIWDRHGLVVGPQCEDPSVGLRATVDAVAGALLSIDRALKLDAATEIRANAGTAVSAFSSYWTKLPAVERSRLFI